MRKTWFVTLATSACLLFLACGGDDKKSTGDPDTLGGDAATEAAGEATAEASDDTGVAEVGTGPTYAEPNAGVTWTVTPVAKMKGYDDAVAACSTASVDGLSGWRLPTVGEARGLYRDCPDLETGGACGLGAACLQSTCNDAACKTCQTPSSQPAGQCKAVQELQQGWDGAGWYWTSDAAADTEHFWVFNLCQGAFNDVTGGSLYDVRCVR
jgi:hypothetical protein